MQCLPWRNTQNEHFDNYLSRKRSKIHQLQNVAVVERIWGQEMQQVQQISQAYTVIHETLPSVTFAVIPYVYCARLFVYGQSSSNSAQLRYGPQWLWSDCDAVYGREVSFWCNRSFSLLSITRISLCRVEGVSLEARLWTVISIELSSIVWDRLPQI